MVPLRTARAYQLDNRADTIPITLRALKRHVQPMTRTRTAVHPHLGIRIQCTHHNVDPPVPVQITERATSMAGRSHSTESRSFRQFLPGPVRSWVPEQAVELFN